MPLNDVGVVAVLVGNHDCYYGTAVVGESHFVALGVTQNE